MRQRLLTVLTVALAAVVATGCAGVDRPVLAPAIILEADSTGAILFDGRDKTYYGVRRDGSVVWRVPADTRSPTPSGCLTQCPDAVLSGSAVSANSGSVPDPAPVFIVDGRRQTAALAGVKRAVLSADGPGDFVLSAGDGRDQWLEVHAGGQVRHRVPVPGFHTSWRESADGGWALAITAEAGGTGVARWFHRAATGWQPAQASVAVTGTASCLAPDGGGAMLLGQRPAVLDRTGAQRPVTDLQLAGTCALGTGGGIVADLFQGPAGLRSDIRIFAGDTVTWRRELPGESAVSAHSTRVTYTVGNELHEIDLRTGTELRTVASVRAARYDRAGTLVIVDPDGHLHWLDPA